MAIGPVKKHFVFEPDEYTDKKNQLVLPGVVDIHGDAFERCVAPRSGSTFPVVSALLENDTATQERRDRIVRNARDGLGQRR